MKQVNIGNGALAASEISLGCMRIRGMERKDVPALIATALECGVDFFDHADIYGGGLSEEMFAGAVAEMKVPRDKLLLQSKCGIRTGPSAYYDFSREHILEAVEGSLKRLRTNYLDVLLLHRPDALAEPEEVASAFDALHASGKVRHFGVSNHNPMQMELLKKHVRQPLVINQLQLGAMFTGMIDAGLNVNMKVDGAVDRDGSILDYCRLHDVTIQPWSPFQVGFFQGVFLGDEKYPELNAKIGELAEKYGVPDTAVAIAWLLRHPAGMQPVVGTTNPARLRDICKASGVTLTRPEWYEIYKAAGNKLP
jgi:predicted oxidoreductase